MTYQEYLFGELLALHNKTYANMKYDRRFNLLPILYQEFTATLYNDKNKSEYNCITAYLKDKDYSGTILDSGKNKYKIKKERFLDWYFSDREDKETITTTIINDLMESGESNITTQQLFDNCGYIPDFICEMTEHLNREFNSNECVLI